MTAFPAANAPRIDNTDARFASRFRSYEAILAIALIAAVYLAGAPSLDAPWLLGDEFIFIVYNPDVTGAGSADPLPLRWLKIFGHAHEDLYQPVPMLAYAIQWSIGGGAPVVFRRTDLLLHMLNSLLVWRVLLALLARNAIPAARSSATSACWCLAAVWALHPTLVNAYAGDLGTPHLLTAALALTSLLFHLRAIAPGRRLYFIPALVAVILANLSKPMPGWLLVIVVVEMATVGWRAMLRSPRVYLIALVSAGSAILTLYTSREAGLIAEATKGLFGDPATRSLLAAWVYFRNIVAPAWLSAWYLPDPATSWSYPLVWLGLACLVATVTHALLAWLRPADRTISIGWAWFWGLLLPVLGLVGARETVAFDRYLYQPLIGVAVVLGTLWLKAVSAWSPASRRFHFTLTTAAMAAAVAPLVWNIVAADSPIRLARSTIGKSLRVVQLNPGDPRALEMLAAGYDYARNHPLPSADLPPPALDRNGPEAQFAYFNERFADTLTAAAAVPDLNRFFAQPGDRAQFHRRLSYRFLTCGRPADALSQAERARELEPDAYGTWLCLARACKALGHLQEAAVAYGRGESLLPNDATVRAIHLTEHGILLSHDLEDPAGGLAKLREAAQTGRATGPAWTELARCEIRAGKGADGHEIIRRILAADPRSLEARLLEAEYHLRSHHWDDAVAAYGAILDREPANYDALLGYQEVCLQIGRMRDAAAAWDSAASVDANPAFRSFLVWSLACANDESAAARATELLEREPQSRHAHLALMLLELRAGRIDNACERARLAAGGQGLPGARELDRARSAVRVMVARKELLPDAVLVDALLSALTGRADVASTVIGNYLAANRESRWRATAEKLLADLPPAAGGN